MKRMAKIISVVGFCVFSTGACGIDSTGIWGQVFLGITILGVLIGSIGAAITWHCEKVEHEEKMELYRRMGGGKDDWRKCL